jgi:hypothetical protein
LQLRLSVNNTQADGEMISVDNDQGSAGFQRNSSEISPIPNARASPK